LQEHRRVALVGGADYRDTRGVVETLLNELDADRPIRITPTSHPGFAGGACGQIEWGSETIGHIGKIDRAVADQLSLRELPMAAELDLVPLLAGAQHVPQLHPLPKYPAVRRDLSLILPESTRYEQLESTVRGANPADLEAIEYVTTYRGKPLDAGQK